MQHCHTTGDSKAPACITIANGLLSIKAEGGQRLFKLDMGTGNVLESTSDNPVKTEPRAQDETLHHEGEMQENKSQETWPFTECKTWHDSSGNLEVVYAQVKRLLDWEALPLITQDLRMSPINGNAVGELNQKVIMDQGPWCDEESTMAWERYMQTEGLSQHVCCQHCDSTEKPMAVFWAL